MNDATVSFPQPKDWELDVFVHVAKKMVAEHVATQPNDPVCGITFSFLDKQVSLTYLATTGKERPGIKYPANGIKARNAKPLFEAVRVIKSEGLFL